VIERRLPGGVPVLRFSLDPGAEYLAAIRQIFILRPGAAPALEGYFVMLRNIDGYPTLLEGYLAAFATCYRTYQPQLRLPEISFPWEQARRNRRRPNVPTGVRFAGKTSSPDNNKAPAMPVRETPEKFLVAFSFAGEQRELVRSIAEAVEERVGRSKVFLDEWYEDWIAGSDVDSLLQNIYSSCAPAVVCISERYGGKPWTLAEYEMRSVRG
jgi:hypothetical protein